MTIPLWKQGVVEISAGVASGAHRITDTVGSAVDRMRAVNPRLNAVVVDLGKQALAEAEAAEARLAGGAPARPLEGVPVTIKVNADQTGHATTNGVEAYKDMIAPGDAPVVTNLKQAGAIVIGRTNTPEFSFRATTDNPLHGRTLNPWDPDLSPGGSSGGASSAVMAGMGAIGHGNDIGGSLRFPAYCCGAVSIKPGQGRVPAYNPSLPGERGLLAQLMSVQGPICRSAADLRPAMQAMAMHSAQDPWQVPMHYSGPTLAKTVAFTKTMFEFELHPEMEAALDHAAEALRAAGYDVVEAEPPELHTVAEEAASCLFGETIEMLGGEIQRCGSDTIQAIFREYEKQFTPHRGGDLLRAMAARTTHIRAWTQFLAEYPLILTPFMPTPPFTWDRDTEGAEGVREVLGAAIYSVSMNYLGLPAGNVPAGRLAASGQPLNVQIVGQKWREDWIIDAMEVVEHATGTMAPHLWSRD